MTSIAAVVVALRAVLHQARAVRRHLATTGWESAAEAYRTVLAGSADPAAAQITALDAQIRHRVTEADRFMGAAESAIEAMIARLGGAVANQHGDHYPEQFGADSATSMPPRVRRGARNAEMMGYATVDGREFGKLGATRTDPWTEQVRDRLMALGLHRFVWLAHHVEMKAVALLLGVAGTSGEIRINHAPCGSEPRTGSGCHQVLPDFIPSGCSLTVLGTDSKGQPFQRTYQGRSPR